MFNAKEIKELRGEIKDLRRRLNCVEGFHEWIVTQGMEIKCRNCSKRPTKTEEDVG